jgi:hypothetical protein
LEYIVKYENFNESRGISNSCEKITNSIWLEIEPDIVNSINFSKKFTFTEEDFKIEKIEINFKFTKNKYNLCNAITNMNLNKIDFNIEYHDIDEPFLYYIKSVVLHEIVHVFQNYNLNKNNKFRPESFSIGSVIPQLRKNINTKYVSSILDVLYYSLSHELSAQLHQYYIYKMDGRKYNRLDYIKDLISNFNLKDLDTDEEKELDYVKNHILNSIKYFTTNKNYKKKIEKSIWNKNNKEFLNELADLLKYKIGWIDKKIKLIDNKSIIDYNETFTYYGDLKDYKYLRFSTFIKENLSDCPFIYNI